MNDREIGLAIRALRRRRGLRQLDVAEASGLSQALVSLVERGHVESTNSRSLRKIAAVLDARVVLELRWRGGELDRLVDSDHASLSARCASRLRTRGWRVTPEVTYSSFGERGSIDLFAFHESSGSLLVVEIKTEIVSAEQTLRKLDEKARLGRSIGADHFGSSVRFVSKLLVVRDGSTSRRRVAGQAALFELALPTPPRVAREWLWIPSGSMAALLFLSSSSVRSHKRETGGRHRVRLPRTRARAIPPNVG